MKNKVLTFLLVGTMMFTSAIPVFASTDVANTNSSTSEAGVIDTYDGIHSDTDSNKTTVKVSQSSSFKVSIPKTVSLNGKVNEENKGTYSVSAEGNIASNEVIVVSPAVKSFYLVDKSLAKDNIIATIYQPVINFVGVENKNKNYSNNESVIGMSGTNGVQKAETTGTISVDKLSAGDWEGSFNFHIALKKTIEEASTEGVDDSSSTGSTDSSSASSTGLSS